MQICISKKLIWIIIPLFLILLYDAYQERYIPPEFDLTFSQFIDKAGVIHIHSEYSDGSGTFKEIAHAAHDSHADFIIIADHNTWQSFEKEKEKYIDDVLVLIGNEWSSPAGYILILPLDSSVTKIMRDSLSESLPAYNDKHLLFLAHPFNPKNPIRNWNFIAYNGFELINGDTEWRNDSIFELFHALMSSLIFDSYLNLLLDVPKEALEKWDKLLSKKPAHSIGSTDAHANIKLTKNWKIKFPSYKDSFRMLKTHVLLEEDFTGETAHDKELVYSALKNGNCYIGIDGYCDPRGFNFFVKQGNATCLMGDSIFFNHNTVFIVESPDKSNIRIKLIHNGNVIKVIENSNLEYHVTDPGIYRTEIYQLRRRLPFFRKKERPWIFSNPIKVQVMPQSRVSVYFE